MKDHLPPSQNDELEHSLPLPSRPTTSTFSEIYSREMLLSSTSNYNSDIPPYQHWVFHSGEINIENPAFREKLYHGSSLLRKVSRETLWKIVARGWYYSEPGNPDKESPLLKKVDWTDDLEDAFIDATSKAMVIGTSFITKFKNGTYKVFTQNNIVGPVYGNDFREITEVYLKYPIFSKLIHENTTEKTYSAQPIGFLTQYSKDKVRPYRFGSFMGSSADNKYIYRDCVIITPYPDINEVFGKPFFYIELSTALERLYLRSYGFAYMHYGGQKPLIGFPAEGDDTLKNDLITELRRGVFGRGLVLDLKGVDNVNEALISGSFNYSPLNLSELNALVSEDALFSRQRVQGAAESGALGGQAPKVNRIEDIEREDAILYVCEKIIKDINYVFFGIKPYEEVKDEDGRIVRVPTYDVVFIRPEIEDDSADKSLQGNGAPKNIEDGLFTKEIKKNLENNEDGSERSQGSKGSESKKDNLEEKKDGNKK